jgi:phthalate 4,5-dioxygenase oxygenase subunit
MTPEENVYLTRVESGAPMGTLVRRYWMPIMLESEVPGPNMAPVRSRVVGEDFLVWRDAAGNVGLFQEQCMHRSVSLSLARCEGDGLRCIFHGWKVSTSGRVLDIPNQSDPTLKDRVRAPVHPARVAGGLLWVYLGPRECEPAFPRYAFMDVDDDHRYANRMIWNANFVQAVEGNLDSSHIGILHKETPFFGARSEHLPKDTTDTFIWDDNSPEVVVADHPFGFFLAAIRDGMYNDEKSLYGRVHNYILPFTTIVPAPGSPIYAIHVPIDDTHTMTFGILYSKASPLDKQRLRSIFSLPDHMSTNLSPEVKLFLGSRENNWCQDRSSMDGLFSGLESAIAQDLAVSSAQQPIVDRSKQAMIVSDVAIARLHHALLTAASGLEDGSEPHMPSPVESAQFISGEGIIEESSDWPRLIGAAYALTSRG